MAGNVPLEPPRIRLTLGNYGAACSDLSKSIVPAGGRVARMTRPSIYDALGGARALRALAADFHARCVADPVLEHPFSHTSNPEHVERLADYGGEVLGAPPLYSDSYGGHSAMLSLHANQGAEAGLGHRFVEVFDEAVDSAGLPADPELRAALH